MPPPPDPPLPDDDNCELTRGTGPALMNAALLQAQSAADRDQAQWRFNDPRRAAATFLAEQVGGMQAAMRGIRNIHSARGRVVYRWSARGRRRSIVVVMSRPYWLSFYARDPKQVAWVVLASWEKECDK